MRCLVACVLAVGCGGSSNDHPIVIIDSTVTADTPPVGTLINITSFGDAPSLLAVRSGTGPWQSLAVTTTSFTVTSAVYQLLAVCQVGASYETAVVGQAVTDGDVFQPCFVQKPGTTAPPTVAVGGQVAQPGTVWMEDTASGTTTPWSYQLAVTPGAHDLIAVNSTKLAIQRGLTITTAGTEPMVDVAATGTAFDLESFVLTGRFSGDVLTNDVEWLTENEFIDVTGTGATLKAVPTTLLDASTDLEVLDVTATNGLASRTVNEFSGGAFQTTVTLLPPLSGITFSAATAQWTTLPSALDQVSLELLGAANSGRVEATATWIDTATSLALDVTGVPGYDPAWAIGTVSNHILAVTQSTAAASIRSQITDGVPLAARKPAKLRALRARLRR